MLVTKEYWYMVTIEYTAPPKRTVLLKTLNNFVFTYSGGATPILLIMRVLWVGDSLLTVGLWSASWCRKRLCSSKVSLRLRKSASRPQFMVGRTCLLSYLEVCWCTMYKVPNKQCMYVHMYSKIWAIRHYHCYCWSCCWSSSVLVWGPYM